MQYSKGDIHIKKQVLIADAGYSWLQVALKDRYFWATVMFDDMGNFLQGYFDITAGNSFEDMDNPKFQDMYLDLVLLSDGRILVLDREELEGLLVENSDEPYADRIAKGIMEVFRRGGSIDTTRQLAAVVEKALEFLPAKERKETVKKSCQRTFQALRIDVNSEFEVLYAFLDKLPGVLKSGGRVAVLTFHSGEDRLVKKAFRQHLREGVYSDVAADAIRPSAEECFRNPRAKSTKLRWAIKE